MKLDELRDEAKRGIDRKKPIRGPSVRDFLDAIKSGMIYIPKDAAIDFSPNGETFYLKGCDWSADSYDQASATLYALQAQKAKGEK